MPAFFSAEIGGALSHDKHRLLLCRSKWAKVSRSPGGGSGDCNCRGHTAASHKSPGSPGTEPRGELPSQPPTQQDSLGRVRIGVCPACSSFSLCKGRKMGVCSVLFFLRAVCSFSSQLKTQLGCEAKDSFTLKPITPQCLFWNLFFWMTGAMAWRSQHFSLGLDLLCWKPSERRAQVGSKKLLMEVEKSPTGMTCQKPGAWISPVVPQVCLTVLLPALGVSQLRSGLCILPSD